MGLIMYEKLEEVINDLEGVFKKHDLDVEEQKISLGQVLLRIKKGMDKQRMSDLVTGAVGGGMIKGMLGKLRKTENDEDDI